MNQCKETDLYEIFNNILKILLDFLFIFNWSQSDPPYKINILW